MGRSMAVYGYSIDSTEALVLIQIGIEFILILLVIALLYKFRKSRTDPLKGNVSNILNLIEESEKICKTLSANLNEKRALADRLLKDIDSRIQELHRLKKSPREPARPVKTAVDESFTTIVELERCGLSVDDIAERLSLSKGEIELVQRIARQERGASSCGIS